MNRRKTTKRKKKKRGRNKRIRVKGKMGWRRNKTIR